MKKKISIGDSKLVRKDSRYETVIFVLLTVLVFLMPIKFGLINLDILHTTISPVPNFIDLFEPWPEEFAQILILVIVFFWFLKMIVQKKIVFRMTKLDILMWIFLGVGIFSTVFSVILHSSVVNLKQFISYVLLYHIVVNTIDSEKKQRIVIGALLVSVCLVSLYGSYQYLRGFEAMRMEVYERIPMEEQAGFLARIERGRVFSTFVYPNSFAGFLLLVLPVSGIFLFLKRHWFEKKNLYRFCLYMVLLFIPAIACFVLTQSKAGFLTFIIVLLLSLILFHKKLKLTATQLVSILIIISVFLVGICLTPMGKKFLVEKGVHTFKERGEYWKAGVKMVRRSPIYGSGFQSFSVFYPTYRAKEARDTRNAHNNFLQLLIETGIIGLIAFASFWIVGLYSGWKFIRKYMKEKKELDFSTIIVISAFLGILCFLLHSFADFDLYIPGISLTAWFLLGLMIRNCGAYKEKRIKIKKESIGVILMLALVLICAYGIFYSTKSFNASVHFFTGYSILNDPNPPPFTNPFKEGETEIRKAIWWDYTNHNYHRYLGGLYSARGESNKSISDFEKSIEQYKIALKYNRFSHRMNFSLTLAELRLMQLKKEIDWRKIIDGFKRSVEYYPTNSFYKVYYGYYLKKADNEKKGAEVIQKAIEDDPLNAHNYLGELYFKNGEYENAAESYQRAFELNKKEGKKEVLAQIQFYLTLSQLKAMESKKETDWEKVLSGFRNASGYLPESSFIKVFYAYYLVQAGYKSEGVEEFKEALKHDPDLEKALQSARRSYNYDDFIKIRETLYRLLNREERNNLLR